MKLFKKTYRWKIVVKIYDFTIIVNYIIEMFLKTDNNRTITSVIRKPEKN